MIRESLFFSFGGIKSTKFGILNVSIGDGLFDEPLVANKSINETSVRGNDTPYFIDTRKEPLSIPLRFAFEDKYNDELIDEVTQWLNVDFYQPLFFEGDINKIFYAMPVEGISHIHNGLKNGYLNLTMRCNSPYSYSPDMITPWYKCRPDVAGTYLGSYQWVPLGIKGRTTIEIYNKGHQNVFPEVWINKIGDGDLTITNQTNGKQEFTFTGLKHGEQLYIDCMYKEIESSMSEYPYDKFNDEYLELMYGKNLLLVDGVANIKLKYRYIYG